MYERRRRIVVDEAMKDLNNRTLATLTCDFARVVYLASTRDYKTGLYWHEGLAFEFTNEVAETVLETSHVRLFEKLLLAPLESFVRDVGTFLSSTNDDPRKIMDYWAKLEPYHVLVPHKSDRLARELFFSNVRIALAVLGGRPSQNPRGLQSASPPQ